MSAKLLKTVKEATIDVLGGATATVTSTKLPASAIKAHLPVVLGGAAALGAAGYYLWPKHRVLGLLTGLVVAGEAAEVKYGAGFDVARAVGHAGSVAGSLYWRKHPVWGYVLGGVGASAVAAVFGAK